MTIPAFPLFRKLNLDDRSVIASFSEGVPPYSDFNFTSLWIWDSGLTRVSSLDGSLVVQLSDYVTGQPFYSVTGRCASRCLKIVLDHSAEQKTAPYLKLVPEHVIAPFTNCGGLVVEEDRDNHDYVYSLDSLGSFAGNGFRDKRNSINRIKKRDSIATSRLDLKRVQNQIAVLSLFERWRLRKGLLGTETDYELPAVRRLLGVSDITLVTVGLHEDDNLIACSISEVLRHGFAICHFAKADIEYDGINDYLMQQTARHLLQMNCSFLNYEQDLGIPGLRFSKSSYRPCAFLRKYRVTLRE